jgi:hypothetical protein
MAQSAANLVDHVLPAVPLRQFVVTFPFELRARLAYDGKLLAAVTRIAIESILGFYKRRARDDKNIKGQSGAVSVVQRVSSDLRLNPHLHAIVVDGVFSANSDSVVFHPLKSLLDSDVADLLQVIRVRVVNWLVRKGVVEDRDELTLLDNTDDADPGLTQLAIAAVSGSIPAGPEIHQRPPVSLRGEPEVAVLSPLCASSMGFTLHAATTVSAGDARAREALARYVMRPPLAQERLHLLPDNLVRIELKRAFRDGDAEEWLKNQTIAIDLDPLSLLCRLAAAVPPPGFHLVHYAGVLGAASKLRGLVIPPPNHESSSKNKCSRTERPATHRDAEEWLKNHSHYRPWAELMKRAFEIDVLQCPNCDAEEWLKNRKGRLKLKALIIEAHNIERLLRHLGEPLEPPKRSPARDPPYFKSKVLRRKLGELN